MVATTASMNRMTNKGAQCAHMPISTIIQSKRCGHDPLRYLSAHMSISTINICSYMLLKRLPSTSRAKPRCMPALFRHRPSDQPTGKLSPPPAWRCRSCWEWREAPLQGSVLIDARPLHYASAAHLIPDFNKRREGRDSLGANAGHPLQLFHRIEGPLSNNGRGLARTDAGERRE